MSFSASDNFPQTNINFADLLVHATMYGILAVVLLVERRKLNDGQINEVKWLLPALIIPSIVGVLTELVQYLWIDSRTGEVADGLANVAGAMIVVLGYRVFSQRLHQ